MTSANTHGLGLISTNCGGTKRYYHFDALGTTWALTSGSGTVTDTYSYTAFGVLLSPTGTSVLHFMPPPRRMRGMAKFGLPEGWRLFWVPLPTPPPPPLDAPSTPSVGRAGGDGAMTIRRF